LVLKDKIYICSFLNEVNDNRPIEKLMLEKYSPGIFIDLFA
jgi:hypothetical protein